MSRKCSFWDNPGLAWRVEFAVAARLPKHGLSGCHMRVFELIRGKGSGFRGNIGIMEKKMETTGTIGII